MVNKMTGAPDTKSSKQIIDSFKIAPTLISCRKGG